MTARTAVLDEPEAGQAPEPAPAVREPGRARLVLRRFRRNRAALFGAVVVALLFFMAYIGIHFTHWSYLEHDYEAFYQGPSGDHWFGTTQTGGDVFALTMRGLQKSLLIGLIAAVVSTGLASVVGSVAGYFGGVTDRVLSWIVELMLVVPSFLVIAVLSPGFRTNFFSFTILIAMFLWMVTSRVVRGYTLTLKNREFVRAARYMGVRPATIIGRHILPNIASLLLIDAAINTGAAVVTESSLSFLGFGIQPPDVSLGTVLSDGAGSAIEHSWLFFFPAAFLVLFVLAVNLIADGLRDALDPTSRAGAAK